MREISLTNIFPRRLYADAKLKQETLDEVGRWKIIGVSGA